MASAIDRVLETYELLEAIIASIDTPRHIFIIQRVCKAWQIIITRSATIGKIIFAVPKESVVAPKAVNPAFESNTDVIYGQPLELNQLITNHLEKRGNYFEDVNSVQDRECISIESLFMYEAKEHNPASSHRKLFLSQPPCTTVVVGALRSGSRMRHWIRMDVRDENGVKFGLLEDHVANVATRGGTEQAKRVQFCVELSVPKTADTEAIRAEWEEATNAERSRQTSGYSPGYFDRVWN